MVYTSYTKEEWEALPEKYRKQVVGISDSGEVMQPPKCPECSSEMMENQGYLSCIECGAIRRIRVLS